MKKIKALCAQIAQHCQPQKIILFSRRLGLKGELRSFKLCVVAAVADKRSAARDIYLQADCDVPFDLLFYLPDEWETLRASPDAFANTIDSTGRVLYE